MFGRKFDAVGSQFVKVKWFVRDHTLKVKSEQVKPKRIRKVKAVFKKAKDVVAPEALHDKDLPDTIDGKKFE